MSRDLNDLLGQDETIVLQTRQHWFILVRDAGVRIVGLVAVLVGAFFAARADQLDNTGGDYLVYALLAVAAIIGLTVLWRVLGWLTERFYITTSKVIYAYGILNRDVTSTPLVKIDEIKLNRPFIGRIFGFGRLEVENAAGGKEPLAGLEYLPKPVKLYRILTERSRNQRMVEGGAHRDDDNDGLVDRPAPVAAVPAAATPRDDDRDWKPSGDSTAGR